MDTVRQRVFLGRARWSVARADRLGIFPVSQAGVSPADFSRATQTGLPRAWNRSRLPRSRVRVKSRGSERCAGHVPIREQVEYTDRRAGPERRPMGECELLVFAFHQQGHLCSM